ncbi:hypothetical protein AGMMS49950_07930 [Endomicrobiia bacterium]|nr:hypothetical protein AGMMS49950_07930 [Endomicrobiia bacterium]
MPTYAEERDRICLDGSHWLTPLMRDMFSHRMSEWHRQYSDEKKLFIDLLMRWRYSSECPTPEEAKSLRDVMRSCVSGMTIGLVFAPEWLKQIFIASGAKVRYAIDQEHVLPMTLKNRFKRRVKYTYKRLCGNKVPALDVNDFHPKVDKLIVVDYMNFPKWARIMPGARNILKLIDTTTPSLTPALPEHRCLDVSNAKPGISWIHEEILQFVQANRASLEKENFVIFPLNENAWHLVNALEVQSLYDTDRFHVVDIKPKWYGTKSIKIGQFGEKSAYDNVTVIYTDDHRYTLEEFLMWYRGFDTRNLMILRADMIHGEKARQKVLEYDFQSVLDVGAGYGLQSKLFADRGYDVTGITFPNAGEGRYTGNIALGDERIKLIIGDFNEYDFTRKFDIVWACHVMEHVPDILKFVEKIKQTVNPGGIIAITVPNNEPYATLSHIHKFNAGVILRNLVYVGIDCRNAKVLTYNYNLSIVIPDVAFFEWSNLRDIFHYIPADIEQNHLRDGNIIFDGDISNLNWCDDR